MDERVNKGRIHLRWFETSLVLAVVAACAVLGPLRSVFATVPALLLVATAVLFLTPGVLIVRWFCRARWPPTCGAVASRSPSLGWGLWSWRSAPSRRRVGVTQSGPRTAGGCSGCLLPAL